MSASPFGTDLASLPNPAANGVIDLDPSMVEATGRVLLAQSLIRRQTTPRGSVIDAPNDCLDVRQFVSAGMTQADLSQLGRQIKKELEKDQRVTSADIAVTYTSSSKTLTLIEGINSAAGPFTLTISTSGTDFVASVLGS
jgi:hypothetical protein